MLPSAGPTSDKIINTIMNINTIIKHNYECKHNYAPNSPIILSSTHLFAGGLRLLFAGFGGGDNFCGRGLTAGDGGGGAAAAGCV